MCVCCIGVNLLSCYITGNALSVPKINIHLAFTSFSLESALGFLIKFALVLSCFVSGPLLCVTLDGQILGRWVFVADVTRGVVSVTKSTGLGT